MISEYNLAGSANRKRGAQSVDKESVKKSNKLGKKNVNSAFVHYLLSSKRTLENTLQHELSHRKRHDGTC